MDDNMWIWSAAVVALFLLVEGVLYIRRARRLQDMETYLRRAKEEVGEIAQLPLNNPFPVIQLSLNGHILLVNPSAEETFPKIREEGLSHPTLHGIAETIQSQPADQPLYREVLFGNQIFHQTIIPTYVQGATAVIIYYYDITERKQHEQELKRARQKAEEAKVVAEHANQARGDFLANMSHELRTPMNGIIGLSGILVESEMESQQKEFIKAVNSSARNLLILLNDILDFSKIEAGELAMEQIPFDIRQIITQVESLQKPVAEAKGLKMLSEVADNVPAYITGDPSRLQQILNNLINNAVKFTSEGSITLSVSGEKKDENTFTTCISVTDTGIGIAKDKQEKVFAKFQQADASTARKYGGTGLGLAITKDLATLMGGNISIQSEEGKGTTFTVTLPAPIPDPREIEKHENASQKNYQFNKEAKLLIVDDNPVNLMVLAVFLKNMGMRHVIEVSTGKQALEKVKQDEYDLILMDCHMPEMNGFEATAAIREMGKTETDPIIIAVTADAMKGAAEKCKSAGMNDYISKPIDNEQLAMLIERWLPLNTVPHEENLPKKAS